VLSWTEFSRTAAGRISAEIEGMAKPLGVETGYVR
jgi:hypothetical protein